MDRIIELLFRKNSPIIFAHCKDFLWTARDTATLRGRQIDVLEPVIVEIDVDIVLRHLKV